MRTTIEGIMLIVHLTDKDGHPLSNKDANRLIDDKMDESVEMLKIKLGDRPYSSIEVESGLDGDDFAQLRRTIIAKAWL